jgi:undecaprenyl-diphosphatase
MTEATSTSPRLATTVTRLIEIDALALRALRDLEQRHVTAAMRWLTRAGDTSSWLLHAAVASVLITEPHAALLDMAVAGFIATLVVAVLKRTIRRPRPRRTEPGLGGALADPDAFSFPSGHTAVAFAVAVTAIDVAPSIAAPEMAFACGVAFSRVYLGAHYPLDVLVGIVIGVTCASATLPFIGWF